MKKVDNNNVFIGTKNNSGNMPLNQIIYVQDQGRREKKSCRY
jgi:hypothetical protein